jgi:hypothetical protein
MKTSFNKNRLILALLAAVVIASGCTDTESGTDVDYTQNTGITVEEFDVFPDTAMSGTDVQLNTQIKNTGGATANNVQLTVFNIPAEAWGTDGRLQIDSPVELAGTLNGPDVESGIPASPVSSTFSLTTPDLDEGVVIPYDVMGQISYEYETTGVTEIVVMGQQRWQENQPARGTPSVDNSGGPIQISVNTRSPIILFDGSSTANQLCVQVENTGEGQALLPSQEDPDNKVEISHTSQSGDVELTAATDGGQNDGDGVVTLNNNGGGTTCYNVDASGTEDNLKTTIPVTFTADYTYEKEVSTSVTVEGR